MVPFLGETTEFGVPKGLSAFSIGVLCREGLGGDAGADCERGREGPVPFGSDPVGFGLVRIEPPETFEVTIGLLTTFLESTREEVRTDVRSGEDFGLEKERSFSLEGHKRGDKEGSGT